MCNYTHEAAPDNSPVLSKKTIDSALDAFLSKDGIDPNEFREKEPLSRLAEGKSSYISAAEANKRFMEFAQQTLASKTPLTDEKPSDDTSVTDEKPSDDMDWRDMVSAKNNCEKEKGEKEKELLHNKRFTDWQLDVMNAYEGAVNGDKNMQAYMGMVANLWSSLPRELQNDFSEIPGVKEYITELQRKKDCDQFEKEISYDHEKIVDEIGEKFKRTHHLSTSDAHTLGSDPVMMSDFLARYVPDSESNQNYTELMKKYDTGAMKKALLTNLSDAPDTLHYATFPANSNILSSDGNSPDKKVADVIENELRHYKENNESMKIGRPYDPTVDKQKSTGLPPFIQGNSTAEQCDCACNCKKDGQIAVGGHFDASVTNDLPKSMVDKIVTIPGEYWRYHYNKNEFSMTYSFKSRTILLTFNIGELNGESSVRTPLLKLDYNNNGLGELAFTRQFDSEQEINSSGPNAIRMYTWLIQVVTTFFLK